MKKNITKAVEGVVIGKYFVTEDKFKEFFTNIINTSVGDLYIWKEALRKEVAYFSTNYEALLGTEPMHAYAIWEYINKKYFNTKEVQILAARGLHYHSKKEIYSGKIENAVLTTDQSNNTIQVDIKAFPNQSTQGVIKDVTKAIQWKHYSSMAKTIRKESPDDEELDLALYKNNKQLSKQQQATLWSKLKSGYKIYDDLVFGKTNYGKIWEAYIHHLAHYHGWNLDIKDLGKINQGPKYEEGNYFLTLLYAANAGANFTGGGDVIVVKAGKIKTNVQIKGIKDLSQNRIGNPVGLYTAKNKYLDPLLEVLNQDSNSSLSDKVISKLYNELKNSAWIDEATEQAVEELNLEELITAAYNKTGYKMTWNQWAKKHF